MCVLFKTSACVKYLWLGFDIDSLPMQLNGQPVGQPVPVGPNGQFTTQITAPSADGQYPLRIDYIPPGATTPGASTTDTLNVGSGSGVGPNGFTITYSDGSSGRLQLHASLKRGRCCVHYWPYFGQISFAVSIELLDSLMSL